MPRIMDIGMILIYLIKGVILVFSIVVHEVAHGYAAYRLGDPTAAHSNRLTLNPIAHVDLFGSIILPAILIFSGSPVVLGWAKPVPFNPYYFKNYKRGVMITGAAGPISNFVLAMIGGVCLFLVSYIFPQSPAIVEWSLVRFIAINIGLGVFNLIPIPPLDGSRILYGLLPSQWADKYMSLEPYGIYILIALLFALSYL